MFVGKFGRLGGEWEFFHREGGNKPILSVFRTDITIPQDGTAQDVIVKSNTTWSVL